MRILGIDPGYATTGFGILQAERASVQLINYGTITTPTTLSFPERLEMLYGAVVLFCRRRQYESRQPRARLRADHARVRHGPDQRGIRRRARADRPQRHGIS